jgi:hypothetical protein
MAQCVHTGNRTLFFKKQNSLTKFNYKSMKIKSNFQKILHLRKLLFSAAMIVTALTIWACKDIGSDVNSPLDMPSGGDGVIQLKYTAEVTTRVKTDAGNDKLTGMEEIASMPKVKKSEVDMIVYSDGTCDMTTKELTPSHQLININDLTPQGKHPKGVFTKVDRQGNIKVYDKDNKEIRNFKMNQKLDLSQWVSQIKQDTQAANATEAFSYIFGNKSGGVKGMLEMARKSGGTVTAQSDGTILVRIGNPGDVLDSRGNEKVFTESVVDTVQNIVKASAIFDKNNKKMLAKMAYTYKGANRNKELTHVYMESYNPKSPGNRRQRTISVTEISGVTLKINR